MLAKLMLSGELNGRRDPSAAAERLQRAAVGGLPDAQADLGKLYQSGKIVGEKNVVKAVHWYRSAAEAGQPEAQANLGLLYESGRGVGRDAAQAVEWFRKAAEQGNALGQGALGLALFHGNGVQKDVVGGYAWTILAAQQQEWTATSNMGAMKSQMTAAQLTKARREAAELRNEKIEKRPPRRSRLRAMRTQQQTKARGDRIRTTPRPTQY
jgi:TPR repeat protein